MSGPIVRKYGFPNFEQIFGTRELKHGVEGEPEIPQTSQSPAQAPEATPASEPPKADAGPSKPD